MIDHVLGRPSTKFRKLQVFIVVLFWSSYLLRGNRHGPPVIRTLSARLSSKLTVWRTTVIVFLWLYLSRNFAKIVGLECPEPLANLYSRSFFRATWITTALDAGFWTAMKIKPKWLRDIASLVFTVYYLFAAEQADEKVHRFRATLTVDHLRVSWNKATSPYLWVLASLMRPRLTKYAPRAIRIPRPRQSVYKDPVAAWLYFDGPLSVLREQTCIVLDIPGGGFVAMNPRTSEDKLLAWAGRTKLPILSLDYKKAPEYPYPYALNECFDVYHTIVATQGRCLGLSGHTRPRIVLTGDSAGGNLAVGLTLMALQSGGTGTRRWQGEERLPRPDGLVLTYPALNVKVESWMTEEQLALIQDRGTREMNQKVIDEKREYYYKLTPSTTPGPSDEALDDLQNRGDCFYPDIPELAGEPSDAISRKSKSKDLTTQTAALAEHQQRQIQTRLAVSSVMAYTNDRILTPEMMRAMIILYIGPFNRPDFSTDFLLSPVLAPEALLARFPKTYFLTGERDPLVDDTVIFAGRLRQAKLHQFRERQELGLEKSQKVFQEKDHVEVSLIPGISHGFLQMAGFFPDAWKHINRCANWIQDLFIMAETRKSSSALLLRSSQGSIINGHVDWKTKLVSGSKSELTNENSRHHSRSLTGESSADEDRPLEMSIGKMTPLFSKDVNQKEDGAIGMNMKGSAGYLEKTEAEREANSDCAMVKDPGKREESTPSFTNTDNTNGNRPRALARRRRELINSLRLSLLRSSPEINGSGDAADDEDEGVASPTATPEGRKMEFRKRKGSLISLPSEEDLLGRRMNGLAGGLNGIGEGARTP
ncbi:hypothetical protein MAP00_005877 [Monascus purpureus]|nr:hypothetical protein MAP00_005877 [Monascus purpureus]